MEKTTLFFPECTGEMSLPFKSQDVSNYSNVKPAEVTDFFLACLDINFSSWCHLVEFAFESPLILQINLRDNLNQNQGRGLTIIFVKLLDPSDSFFDLTFF